MSGIHQLREFCVRYDLEFPKFELNDNGSVSKVFWYDTEVDLLKFGSLDPKDVAMDLINRATRSDGKFFLSLSMEHQKKYMSSDSLQANGYYL